MHYHAEIIMPPTDDVKAAIEKIMAPFDENSDNARYAFWDWWVIGGRYSGAKLEALVPSKKREAFFAELTSRGVTVSGLQFGKQELSPASQQEMVDALWREMCPNAGDICPIFKHSGENMGMDVSRVSEIPADLTAHMVIVATPQYDNAVEAETLLLKKIWNGVTHQETTFGGLVSQAISIHAERIENYSPDFVGRATIKPDWLCVTVDYHS